MGEDDPVDADRGSRPITDSDDVAVPDPLPAPVLGDPAAPVTVAVYEDFACRGCRAFHDNVLPRLRQEYVQPGAVRYEHHDYPRPGVDDPEIYRAANAARAVQRELGDAAFYEFASGLFGSQTQLRVDRYESLATAVGADPDSVGRAARIQLYAATIDRDRQRGAELGIGPVPAIFVDGEEFTGTSLGGLLDLVEEKRP